MIRLCAALALFIVAVNAEEPNLIANPGFEDGGNSAPWQLLPPVYRLVTNQPRSGSNCLRYTNIDPARYWLCSQPLALKPGRRYEITAWIRTENIQGDENGATICVEWADANGKFIGGCYPHGVKGTHTNWQLVRNFTAPVPTNAARCHVSCYVRRGMTGIAWWDDVSVREHHPPLIEAMTTDHYRDQTAGGPVTVHVGLAGETAKLELEVRGPQGQVVSANPVAVVDDRRNPGNPTPTALMERRYRIDTTPWKPGRHEIIAVASDPAGRELGRGTLTLTRVAKIPPRKAYIDAHRRLIVDGEPFFPLGTYWSRIKPDEMAIYAKSPFNCLMPYADVGRAGLDLAHANGIRVIYSVKDFYAGCEGLKTETEARQRIAQTVNAMKDHPALIAWYITDELPLTMRDELTAHRQLLEELDPGRPTWAVLDQPNLIREYLPTFDVIGTDPYPIPRDPPAQALEWARTTVAQTYGARAVWMVPQIFDWASYGKTDAECHAAHPPSLAEMRCMAWSCIAAGANGLIFYSWFDLRRMDQALANGGRASVREPFDERWKDITTMAAEIRDLIPVLLSVEPAPMPTVDAPASVAWRVFAKDGAVFVLCVNSDDKQPARVRLRFPAASDLPERQLELPPLDVQVVRFR